MAKIQEIKIECDVTREIFNKDDFYIYIAEMGFEEISIKVTGFDLCNGKKLLVGHWGKEYNGQKTFNCSYEEFDINSKEAQFNLLCSIDGIKEKTAEKIMNEVDNINVFRSDDYPKIKSVGPGRLILIREGLEKLDQMTLFKDLNRLLGGKCSKDDISKINKIIEFRNNTYNGYGEKAEYKIEDFIKYPYEILIGSLEMSFQKADKIALNIGVSKDNYARNCYLMEYIIYTECKSNCYIVKEDLENILYEKNFSSKFSLTELIDNNERLTIEEDKVYIKKVYEAESETPKLLRHLERKGRSITERENESIEKMIEEFEKLNKIKLDEYQKKAINISIENPISVITGGAGVGKTCILKCVLHCLDKLNYTNVLTSPTGKAARRMNQATNIEASTIHSYIYKNMKDDVDEVGFLFDESEKTNYSNNRFSIKSVMVVDEFSMVDIRLFYSLLCTMYENGSFVKLIVVGDPGQLASVQSGNCLHDLIESEVYPVIKLTKTFRQGKDSNIIPISKSVRENQMFSFIKKSDFFVRECIDDDEYQSQISSMYKYLKDKYDNDLDKFYDEVQFIAPLKKGSNGVIAINETLKKQFNPKKIGIEKGSIVIAENNVFSNIKKGQKFKIIGISDSSFVVENDHLVKHVLKKNIFNKNFKLDSFPFDLNDKIMNLKNDKETDVYNGEFGRIIDISCDTFTVYFSDLKKEVKYYKTLENQNKFQLSYCCTVHKLQGSEFKYICIIMDSLSPLCDSRLLYTAITRGKQTVILLTEKEIIEKVVIRNNLLKRNTFLKERLIQSESDRKKESV